MAIQKRSVAGRAAMGEQDVENVRACEGQDLESVRT
jgi:hypothetical protein